MMLLSAILAASITNGSLTVSAGDNTAGAITSITWQGKQFVDNYDHGRQCQSASSFDGLGEYFNPTEAGGAGDGPIRYPSSSRLQYQYAKNILYTDNLMAYWFPVNGERLSKHRLQKWARFALPNVIEYAVQFTVPADEQHESATFEALTCYLPLEFRVFYQVDFVQGKAVASPLPDGDVTNYEQPKPIVFCNDAETHCLGVYSPELPQTQYQAAGYGRWRFWNSVKWNAVWRVAKPVGTYRFRAFIVVGDLRTVQENLATLHATYGGTRESR